MAVLAFIGFVFNYMLRVNINLTVVYMVNHTAVRGNQSDGAADPSVRVST